MMSNGRPFFFKTYYGPGMKAGIGSRIIGLLMLPFLLVMIPVLFLAAIFSMRKLMKSVPQTERPRVFVDNNDVITVPKIENK